MASLTEKVMKCQGSKFHPNIHIIKVRSLKLSTIESTVENTPRANGLTSRHLNNSIQFHTDTGFSVWNRLTQQKSRTIKKINLLKLITNL